MKKVEERRPTTQRTGCLGWIFGLSHIFNKQKLIKELPVVSVEVKAAPVHQAITGVDLKYTHPELVPSQPEYIEQHGGKMPRSYRGQDPRGG